jgi:hypothetical protein
MENINREIINSLEGIPAINQGMTTETLHIIINETNCLENPAAGMQKRTICGK